MSSAQLQHLWEHLTEYRSWLLQTFDEPLDRVIVDDVLTSLAVVMAVVRSEEAK